LEPESGETTWSRQLPPSFSRHHADTRAVTDPGAIHEIDANRQGKFRHYHPRNRTPGVRSFYGVAQ
jgi:hypothetical protein